MKHQNLVGIVSGLVLLSFVGLACSFSTDVKEPPKYVPNEPINRIEGNPEDINRGTEAVSKFHNLLNQEDFDRLFEWIDEKSQLSQDPVAWSVRMNRIKRELGKVENTVLQRQNVFQKSSTKEIRLEYITKYSKEDGSKPRYELFFFELYPDGETKLLEYMNGIDNAKAY